MLDIHELSLEELKDAMIAIGEKPFRAAQIITWLYKKGVSDSEKFTDISPATRALLKQEFRFSSLQLKQVVDSEDGETTKFLWQLSDEKLIESVLIRSEGRNTVCVSCQVGCPAKCAFCASGKKGLMRNLSVAEIIEQIYLIDQWLKEKGETVSHIVYMGMGEPFENYDNLMKSIRFLVDPERFGISQRKITVSTVGVIEGIKRFSKEGLQVNLVLSLHAPNQKIRQKIIPYAKKYPLEEILDNMLIFSEKTRRNITYEYTLMAGINDSREHAEELAKLIKGHPCTVNLIPYNPVVGLTLRRPERGDIYAFKEILEAHRISVTWRYTKGKDIAAACGQLAQLNEPPPRTPKLAVVV